MLTESIIHLPVRDNDMVSLEAEHERMRSLMLQHFGGFTAHTCMGQWRDPETGKIYKEPVVRYVIAANWSDAPTRAKLLELAELAAITMRQVCIYVAINGVARFIYQPEEKRVAA